MDPLDALTKVVLLNQKLGQDFVATTEAKLPLIEVGQQVSAKVEGQLQNGNFKVTINGQPLQMSLPEGTKPGDSVNLVLIGRDPRLTFKLDLPQSAPSAELSQAGRLVSQLVPNASRPNVPLTSAKPVLPSPPQEPGQLAQALQNTLAKSGLFYESHQAQWVMGERPLEQLMQEPQNASAPMPPPQQSAAQGPASRQLAPQQSIFQLQAESAENPVASQSTHTDAQLRIKESTLPIVRQQIDALESGEFNWNGQIWPGQSMDWQVRAEEDDQGNHQAGDPPKVWLSRLRLTLPTLGEIDANLRLSPTGVQISLKVSRADTESSLKSQSRMLQKSMEANGIALVSMAVKQHG